MMPTEKPAEKETPKAATPKESKKKGELSSAAAVMARAMNAITKSTGHKPIDASDSTLAHIPTGSCTLDFLIGGAPAKDGKGPICPGFPRRRITEVYGPESSGKTTLALSSAVQTQKLGGSILFIDFEHAISKKYAVDIGVNWDDGSFRVFQPDTLEEGLKMLYIGILAGVDLIIVDSVAAMVPKDELLKNIDDPAKIGALAARFSNMLPKIGIWLSKHPQDKEGKKIADHLGTALILLNQERSLIQSGGGGGHGEAINTAGGKALKFYSYLRIRLSRIKSETIKRKDPMTGRDVTQPYGNLTNVKIVKSKVDAKQGHQTQMFIRYGYGIDDYFSVIEAGVTNKFLKKEGAWYIFGEERFQGKDKLRKYMISNPKDFDILRNKILNSAIAGAMPLGPEEELSEEDRILESMGDDFEKEIEGAAAMVSEEIVEGES